MQQQVRQVGIIHPIAKAVDHMIHHALDDRIVLVDQHRLIVAGSGERLGLGRFHAENEDILAAHGLADLHVGAVHRADGQRAVHHELHVARAGGFLARDRDLLGDLRGRHDHFRQGDLVILDEHNLELIPDIRIVVNHIGDRMDELDGLFRHRIARRGLGAENKRARHEVHARVILELVVQRDNMQNVEHLALVLMQALDLHVENRVHVDLDAVMLLNILRQAQLVVALDLAELGEQRLILAIVGEYL